MNRKLRLSYLALSSAAVLGLSACGGGGGSSDSPTTPAAATPSPAPAPSPSESPSPSPSPAPAPTPAPTVASVTLSGTVATGAALEGAKITVTDSTGAVVGTVQSVGADGSYTVTLDSGAQAPFVIVAERDTIKLVSVQDQATSATVNVTPVTTLIASRLSPSGDPAKLPAELAAKTATLDAGTVAAKVEEVKALLKPLTDATGTSGEDPLHAKFKADGTGVDKLLDSLQVTITPDSSTSANIQVSVRQQNAEGQEPASVRFNSSTTPTAPALPAISASALVEDGTSPLIADLMSRLSACYALPLADRVNDTTTSAGPTNVIAAACTSLFVDGNVAGYLSSGARVGYGGAFSGMFRATGTGLGFSQGSYEFTRGNGDLVVGYTTTNPNTGNSTDTGTLVVRKVSNAATGKAELRLIGNQYIYDGGVAAYHQARHFITLNQSASDYYSSGFTLNVPNTVGGTGQPIFDHVTVTSPKGNQFLLKPSAGSSYLNLVKSNGTTTTVTGTNFVRVRSKFIDPTTAGHPSAKDPSLFFVQQDMQDSEIADMSNNSVWKFEYYLASNPTAVAATQTYKTRTRPLTIAELALRGLAKLTDAEVADVAARADTTNGRVPLPTAGKVSVDWTVPEGALAPTNIKLWGSVGSTNAFNDQETVLSTARTGNIQCTRQTTADSHCVVSGTTSNYAAGALANGVHLWARDRTGREFASFYAMYKLQ